MAVCEVAKGFGKGGRVTVAFHDASVQVGRKISGIERALRRVVGLRGQ